MAETISFEAPARRSAVGRRVAAQMDAGGILLRRWAGCWIDLIVVGLIFFGVAFLGGVVLGAVGLSVEDEAISGILALVSSLAVLAYFPVTEGRWGRSLGKLATGTIVVDANGALPGYGRVIVRTLLRLVEVNPFFFGGIPAGLFAAFTRHHQRLGDLAAGTYVVPLSALVAARGAAPASKVDVEVFD